MNDTVDGFEIIKSIQGGVEVVELVKPDEFHAEGKKIEKRYAEDVRKRKISKKISDDSN